MNCELKHQQPTLKYGIPEGWHLVKLSDLGEVNRGRSRHRPRYAEHLYEGPYPFIQTGDIKASNGRIREHKQTYSEAGLAQSRLWPAETMCITIVGANIAETAILRFPACFPDSVIGFIADKSKCDIYFVEYMFRYLKGRVKREAIGSARDNINLGTFERILFPLPPIIEQKAISQLLNNLDNKIEINDEINKNLEAIGQAVFKRWFVDFEFPNQEGKPYKTSGGEMVEVQGELIPQSWKILKLGEVADVEWGDTNTTKASYVGVGFNAFSASGLDGKLDHFDFEGEGIVISAIGAYCGQTWYATGKWSCIKNTIRIRPPSKVGIPYIFFYAKGLDFFPKRGSAQPFISQTDARNILLVIPDSETLERFTLLARSLLGKIELNSMQNNILSQLRDILLPKLMSGKIRVPMESKMERQ